MRAFAVVVVVLAGCFSPQPQAGQPCNPTDDWCPDPLQCGSDKICHDPNAMPSSRYNMVFVTSSPTPQPIYDYDDPVQLDALCANLAVRANLPQNTYVAWVSTQDGINASDRLHDARGFVRTDNAPIADTIQDLLDGTILNPIDFTEHVEPAPYDIDVFTQTDANGMFSALTGTSIGDCLTDPTATIAASGQADATIIDWTQHKTVDCIEAQLLYCFGTDLKVPLEPTKAMPGKLAFLSSAKLPGNVGEAMFDTECNTEAVNHGISETTMFVALMASTTHGASAIGATSSAGWHRPDQQPALTASFDMIAPINVDLDNHYIKDLTWTGVLDTGIANPSTFAADCGDWDSAGGQANVGSSTRSGPQGYHDDEDACGNPHRVFCIEK